MTNVESETGATTATMRVLAVVSLLGDPPVANAATRPFRGRPVLAGTIERIRRVTEVESIAVVAWDDQLDAVRAVASGAAIRSVGPRRPTAALQSMTAALRWSDGWRGGLLGATEFDRGFDAAAIHAALDAHACDAALIVSASAALVESDALDALVAHLRSQPELAYAFAPGSPGTGALLLRRSTLDELLAKKRSPGSLLAYDPDRPQHDPIAKAFALPVPPRVARTSQRLTIDSGRQVQRLAQLATDDNVAAILELERDRAIDPLPRDVVIELTTRRATRPAWSMLSRGAIDRPDLSTDVTKRLFESLASADDVRITFAGVGDPLMHADFETILAAARGAGIEAIHVETDLLPEDASRIDALASAQIDVVSVHLPAAHATTYAELMGVDRMRDVLDNVKRLLLARAARGVGVPIVVPTFVKCERNVGEMEAWYDQWLRAVGAAVVVGPSDFSGRLPYAGVSDMTPGTRGPCRRLRSRLTILSDGTIASCEEDVLGEQRCGDANDVGSSWRDGLSMLRSLHDERRWDEATLCRQCRMWDRP